MEKTTAVDGENRELEVVAHACNTRNSGGTGRRILV
jgi:hypothetical protein